MFHEVTLAVCGSALGAGLVHTETSLNASRVLGDEKEQQRGRRRCIHHTLLMATISVAGPDQAKTRCLELYLSPHVGGQAHRQAQ